MSKLQSVDQDGKPTKPEIQFKQQIYQFVVGMNRIIPANASGTNLITLTLLNIQPLVTQYGDYDTFAFVAANTSTGLVTAQIITNNGTLATLKVYKTNGSAQATTGDVVQGLQYFLTYADSLNSNAGGFVLR